MNDQLNKLHDLLIARHEALYGKLDTAPDDGTMQAILTEMREIRHRIDILQGLLFRQTNASLQAAVQKVSEADAILKDALSSAETAADVVKGVGKFLVFVDKAIDLAKTLAPLAA